jgi:hypothetical protein
MKRIAKLTGTLFVAAIMTFAFSSESQAVPAFARQMGVSCTTCHFQHFPALNAFGRAFKGSGYTMIGSQEKIEDVGLSLPIVLNASLVTKLRIQKTSGEDTKTGTNVEGIGEFNFPDEAALLIGGRATEHVGFLLEMQMLDPDAPAFATFKMPISFNLGDGHFEVIPYVTDSLGAAIGFEVLNTGAVRNARTSEERTAVSAQQYIGTATPAQGFAFVYYADLFHVNASLWGPAGPGTTSIKTLSNYLRVAATPQVAGWDLGFGGQLWAGTTELGDGTPGNNAGNTKLDTNAMALDFQAQGMAGSMPIGVYLTYASAEGDSTNLSPFNNDGATTPVNNPNAKTATALAVELGVLPNWSTVSLAYRMGDNGKATANTDNAVSIGATYQVVQNVQLQLTHMMLSGDANDDTATTKANKSRTTLMLFSAF